MNRFVVWFTKITGLPVQWLYFRKKVYYLNKDNQSKKIKGGALIISNHTSVFDYALVLFTFIKRNIYVLVAKSTYHLNKFMSPFMKRMGSVVVDRKSYDFSFMSEIEDKINDGKVVLFFPEGKIPQPEDKDLLPFKPSFVYIALNTNKPIIPIYTNGQYGIKNFFTKKRAKVMIGEKIFVKELMNPDKTEKENIDYICNYVRDYIKMLGKKLNEIEKQEKEKVPFIVKLFDYKMWFYDFVKWTGCLPVLLDLRLKRVYVKNSKVVKRPKNLMKGKFIIIGNHTTVKDPITMMTSFWERRVGFIAMEELFSNKFWTLLFNGFGCIKINRDNPSIQTFKKVSERLNRGHIVALFPEGGIKDNDEINNFKNGSVLFAILNNCPIIPIYIKKRKHWYNRQVVYIGDKININKYIKNNVPSMDNINEITKKLREKELELEKVSGENDKF